MFETLRIGRQPVASGDTVSWTVADLVDRFPASQGWTLTYFFALAGEEPAAVVATAAGDTFEITWACALAPGTYHWSARVANGATKHLIMRGTIRILPDPSTAGDPRSRDEQILAAMEEMLPQVLSDPLAKYEIPGVKGEKVSFKEWTAALNNFRTMVRCERGGPLVRTMPANRFNARGPASPWGGW